MSLSHLGCALTCCLIQAMMNSAQTSPAVHKTRSQAEKYWVEVRTTALQSMRDVLAGLKMGLDAACNEADMAASAGDCPAIDVVLAEAAAWERQGAEVKALVR